MEKLTIVDRGIIVETAGDWGSSPHRPRYFFEVSFMKYKFLKSIIPYVEREVYVECDCSCSV